MAISHSHTLGEFIGTFFEDLMKRPIGDFALSNGLYFDSIGPRKARKTKKITWADINGSRHDLDFVLERGGTDAVIGEPVAFIELAWRRYTKHSKSKAQEITGAINPICEKYNLLKPFKGAILCGQFTKNAIEQLRAEGFKVLYIPFESLVHAFSVSGLDVDFNEDTDEEELEKKYLRASDTKNASLLEMARVELLKSCEEEMNVFLSGLLEACKRRIRSICILPLHGTRTEVQSVSNAIGFIQQYQEIPDVHKLEYIEIVVTYTNGSVIQAKFKEKQDAIDFLKNISLYENAANMQPKDSDSSGSAAC